MMLLYVCKECGHWADMSISAAIGRIFARAFSIESLPVPEPQCPDGHGAMVVVSAKDRIFAWTPLTEQDLAGLCLVEGSEETIGQLE
jgi:hypothetical protein